MLDTPEPSGQVFLVVLHLVFFDALQLCVCGTSCVSVRLSVDNGCIVAKRWVVGETFDTN